MAQRHKWADVIIAFAEGRDVQFKNRYNEWETVRVCPAFTGDTEYRIKPEKKRGWIVIRGDSTVFPAIFDEHPGPMGDIDDGNQFPVACIEIEYGEGEGL